MSFSSTNLLWFLVCDDAKTNGKTEAFSSHKVSTMKVSSLSVLMAKLLCFAPLWNPPSVFVVSSDHIQYTIELEVGHDEFPDDNSFILFRQGEGETVYVGTKGVPYATGNSTDVPRGGIEKWPIPVQAPDNYALQIKARLLSYAGPVWKRFLEIQWNRRRGLLCL